MKTITIQEAISQGLIASQSQAVEFLKGAAYTAYTQKEALKHGGNIDAAKQVVLKHMNFGLPEGVYWNMNEYLKKEVYNHGGSFGLDFDKDVYPALEFFDVI